MCSVRFARVISSFAKYPETRSVLIFRKHPFYLFHSEAIFCNIIFFSDQLFYLAIFSLPFACPIDCASTRCSSLKFLFSVFVHWCPLLVLCSLLFQFTSLGQIVSDDVKTIGFFLQLYKLVADPPNICNGLFVSSFYHMRLQKIYAWKKGIFLMILEFRIRRFSFLLSHSFYYTSEPIQDFIPHFLYTVHTGVYISFLGGNFICCWRVWPFESWVHCVSWWLYSSEPLCSGPGKFTPD